MLPHPPSVNSPSPAPGAPREQPPSAHADVEGPYHARPAREKARLHVPKRPWPPGKHLERPASREEPPSTTLLPWETGSATRPLSPTASVGPLPLPEVGVPGSLSWSMSLHTPHRHPSGAGLHTWSGPSTCPQALLGIRCSWLHGYRRPHLLYPRNPGVSSPQTAATQVCRCRREAKVSHSPLETEQPTPPWGPHLPAPLQEGTSWLWGPPQEAPYGLVGTAWRILGLEGAVRPWAVPEAGVG